MFKTEINTTNMKNLIILFILLILSISNYCQQTLWGVTISGGDNNDGVIFKFDLSSSTFTKLHDFAIDDSLNGGNPYCSLVRDNNGVLYGTTAYGGINNNGVLYSFDPDNDKYEVIYSFNDSTGGTLTNGFIDHDINYDILLVNDSLLYGILYKSNSINIFEFNIIKNQLTKLIQLPSDLNGNIPGLVKNGSLLYGISNNWIFSVNYITNEINKIIMPPSPLMPYFSKLYLASNNKLYFVDYYGGAEYGALLEYDSFNNVVNEVYKFMTFVHPDAAVSELNNGNIIGPTNGAIYTYNDESKIFDIPYKNWSFYPNGPLTINSSDEAFGMCWISNNNSRDDYYGEIYKYVVSTNSYNILFNFDSINGKLPSSSSLLLTGDILGVQDNSYVQKIVNVFPNPASDKISIDMKDIGKIKLSIYNLDGKLAFQETISNIEESIDISGLTNGIYLIKIESDNKNIYSRFMKK